MNTQPPRRRPGRPKKYHRPSRSLTLTLPDDVIAALQGVDPDLGRAIVRVVQTSAPGSFRPAAELTTYQNRAVISIPAKGVFETQLGVELIPIAAGRALLSFDENVSLADLELRIADALTEPDLDSEDGTTLMALGEILRKGRRSGAVSVRSRRIIVLEYPAEAQ